MTETIVAAMNSIEIFSDRIADGHTLTEYEALAYQSLCKTIEKYMKYLQHKIDERLLTRRVSN